MDCAEYGESMMMFGEESDILRHLTRKLLLRLGRVAE